MTADVERALGGAANVNLTATATVTRAAGVFRAQVHVTSAAGLGERVLEDTRCELLAESVALVIALSAPGPGGARTELEPESPNGGLAAALSAHAGAIMGPLPGPALGAGGTLSIEGIAGFRLEIGSTYYAQQSTTFEQMDLGARFQLLAFGARGCRIWAFGVFDLAPCLGAQFYRIAGRGFGGMPSRSGESWLWGPSLGVLGRLRVLQQVALYVAADGVAPISRQRFVFVDVGPLHRPSVVEFQLFIGPEVRF